MTRFLRRAFALVLLALVVWAWFSTYLELYGLKVAVAGILVGTALGLLLLVAWMLWRDPPPPERVLPSSLRQAAPAPGRRRTRLGATDLMPWDDPEDER